MRRALKIIIITILALIVLVFAGLFIAVTLLDPNDYKDTISRKILEKTGRELVFEGDMEATLFPWLGLKTGAVRLNDSPEFSKDPFMEVKSAGFKLEVLPLLSGKINIDEIILDGVRLKLEVNAKGMKNWAILAKSDAPEAGKGKTPDGGGKGADKTPIALTVNSVSIADSRVRYIDQPGKADYAVDLKKLSVDGIGPGKEAKLDAQLTLSGLKGLGADVSVSGSARLGEDFSPQTVTISSAEVSAGYGKERDLGTLSLALDYSMPEQKAVVKNLSVKSKMIDCTGGLTALLPGAKGLGKGLVADVRGNIDVSRVELGGQDKQPAKEQAGGDKKQTGGAAQASGGGRDFSALAGIYAEVAVTIRELKASGYTLTDIKLPVKADRGLVTVEPYSFSLFDGRFNGKVSADLRGKTPALAATNTIQNLEISNFLQKSAGKTLVKGKLNSNLSVQGRGLDWAALAPTLAGDGSFEVVNGEVKNFVILPSGVIPGIENKKLPTDFSLDKVAGTVAITSGVISNQDLVVASPLLSATGRGTADLPKSRLDYDLDISVPGIPVVPASVAGPFSNLSYKVDVKKLLEGLGKSQLGEKLGEQLKKHLPGGGSGSDQESGASDTGGSGATDKTKERLDRIGKGLGKILK